MINHEILIRNKSIFHLKIDEVLLLIKFLTCRACPKIPAKREKYMRAVPR